ncbi:MAG: energy transducer TonB [Syntrophobacteraceae bacterium]
MGDPAVCDNLADMNSMCLDDDLIDASNPIEDIEISEDGFEGLWLHALHVREILVGFGFSLALHTAALISVFLTVLFFMPPCIPNARFITVSFVDPAGLGCGLEAGQGGRGGDSPGTPVQLASSPPAGRAVEGEEAILSALPESSSTEDARVMPPEMSQESELQNSIEPEKSLPVQPKVLERKERKKIACTRKSVAGSSRKRDTDRAAAPETQAASPSPGESLSPGGVVALENGSVNRSGGGGTEGANPGSDGGLPGGGAGSGRAAGLWEFKAEQVDTPPAAIRKIDPEFPPEARRMGIAGRVVVRFLVKIDGSVSKASVIEANPKGIFEHSALEAIDKWRFKPGRYKGNTVATWVLLPIQFRLTR